MLSGRVLPAFGAQGIGFYMRWVTGNIGALVGALLGVAASAWVFVLLHTGSQGRDLCKADGSTGPGTLSWWPPGTRCDGGEPLIRWTRFNPAWVFAAILLVAAGVAAGVIAGRAVARLGSQST
jgi:ribose/xylose/arabinose/galactoside ABC-type transport system permease subunit